MREKLTYYYCSVIWTPRKSHHIADALSRAPVFGPCDMTFKPKHLERCLRIFGTSLMRMDATAGPRYMQTLNFIKLGKHISTLEKDSGAHNHKKIINQLRIETYQEEEEQVLDGWRLVVPAHKRKAILPLLHAGLSVIAKTQETSTHLYYWPNMKKDIKESISSCTPCQEQHPSNARQTMGAVNLPRDSK